MEQSEKFDSDLSFLIECFPDETDHSILIDSLLEANGCRVNAIDNVLARHIAIDSGNEVVEISNDNAPSGDLYWKLRRTFPTVEDAVITALIYATDDHDSEDPAQLEIVFRGICQQLEESGLTPNVADHFRSERIAVPHAIGVSPANLDAVKANSGLSLCEDLVSYFDEFGTLANCDFHDNVNPQELRDRAEQVQNERLNLFYRASEVYSSGGLTGHGAAQYLSTRGHDLRHLIKQLNRNAARIIFRDCNGPLNCLSRSRVDLHGLLVAEAVAVLSIWVQHCFDGPEPVLTVPLIIITGLGKHSLGGPRLRPAIRAFLSTHCYNSFGRLGFTDDGKAQFSISLLIR